MADFEDAYDAIMGQFKTAFADTHSTVPVAWPGLDFDPATGFNPSRHTGWVRVTVRGGDGHQASLEGTGRRRWRYPGVIYAQVFCPTGAGMNTALAIADDVAAAWRGVTVNGVVLRAASVQPIGNDRGWLQVNVTCPYQFDLKA